MEKADWDDWWPRWVWVGECFFWYQLTRVVPDKLHRAVKWLCVCAYVRVCVCAYVHVHVHVCVEIVTEDNINEYEVQWRNQLYEIMMFDNCGLLPCEIWQCGLTWKNINAPCVLSVDLCVCILFVIFYVMKAWHVSLCRHESWRSGRLCTWHSLQVERREEQSEWVNSLITSYYCIIMLCFLHTLGHFIFG